MNTLAALIRQAHTVDTSAAVLAGVFITLIVILLAALIWYVNS